MVDAYTLALASIMLTAGSTADRVGARKIFTLGLAAFAVGSAACAAAPALGVLVAARQSGGALGVAVLGSLLGRGHALSLHVALLVATAGYLVAIALAWTTIRVGRERRVTS